MDGRIDDVLEDKKIMRITMQETEKSSINLWRKLKHTQGGRATEKRYSDKKYIKRKEIEQHLPGYYS